MYTKLSELVAQKEFVRLAVRSDNQDILDCISKIPMEAGSMQIKYERSPDYFRLIDQQSDRAFVFIFDNDDGTIGGFATIGLRTCYIDGKPERVAYLGDLRTTRKMSRSSRLEWKVQFGQLIENYQNLDEFENCKYLYTAILSKNQRAIKALAKRKKEFIYKEIAPYHSINILGRNPLYSIKRMFKKSKFTVRKATKSDENAIRTFLQKENIRKPIGDYFTPEGNDELDRRIKNWEDFSLESFLLVESPEKELVATIAPWLSTEGRRLVVQKVGSSLKLLGNALPLLRGKRIKEQEELRILYLTHFEICSDLPEDVRNEIFRTAVDYVFESPVYKNKHMITFADFPSRSFKPALKGEWYVSNYTGASIYQVLSKAENENEYFIPGADKQYFSFELGIA